MAILDKLEKFCTKLGKNNKATYAVVTIAAVKGIFRPFFTMMDRSEKPHTKKYTALREGVTELVAIPIYLGCGAIAAKFAHMVTTAEKTSTEFKKAANNFRFAGVCLAAVFVIPWVCSLVIKPIVNKIIKNPQDNQPVHPSQVVPAQSFQSLNKPNIKYPSLHAMVSKPYSGMKVGGL